MGHSTTRDKILKLFRQQSDHYLSGESICTTLGISRAAVWKQIQVLREQGFHIEGIASRGYRLLHRPDRLLASEIEIELGTSRIGRRVIVFEETQSTNRDAHRLGEEGSEDGTVILAETQTDGRGRLGRHWESPAGVNLYLSVILRPSLLPQDVAQLTFASAVAVAETLEEVGGVQPTMKWPNDVLLNGKKVAGLLNEMQAELERVHYVVLGIGVNLNMTADQFPEDLRYPATSVLLETGQTVDRTTFVRRLLLQLDRQYQTYLEQGPVPIMQQWQSRCKLIGRPVQVTGGTDANGIVTGIDPDGALVLTTESGQRKRILSGDVRPLAKEN